MQRACHTLRGNDQTRCYAEELADCPETRAFSVLRGQAGALTNRRQARGAVTRFNGMFSKARIAGWT
jgi:hypothetical protein